MVISSPLALTLWALVASFSVDRETKKKTQVDSMHYNHRKQIKAPVSNKLKLSYSLFLFRGYEMGFMVTRSPLALSLWALAASFVFYRKRTTKRSINAI
jgi:hypothetical protein